MMSEKMDTKYPYMDIYMDTIYPYDCDIEKGRIPAFCLERMYERWYALLHMTGGSGITI